jgi:hypothetical protein
MEFGREYQINLAFGNENVEFKSIDEKILQFIWYSEIKIILIGLQYENVELMSINVRML